MVPFIIIAAVIVIVIVTGALIYAFHDFNGIPFTGFNYPNNPYSKGAIGEAQIACDFDNLNYWGYKGYTLRNIYVPYHGKVTEIDVLYITVKGIIVVESKNYSGYIFGSESQQQWTSTLRAGRYGGSNKFNFYNPIWQNRTHIKALQEYLGGVKAFSFVVFGMNCELMHLSYNPQNVCVCREDYFKQMVIQTLDGAESIYDEHTIEAIYNRLLPLTNVTEEVKARHIDTVRAAVYSEVCPRCGGRLVLRTARQGKYAVHQFYGCSNYPACRYTRDAGVTESIP